MMDYFNRPSRTTRLRIRIAATIVGFLVGLSFQPMGFPAIAATASEPANGAAAPVLGAKLAPGYRDWKLISLAVLGPPFNDVRAKLGNDLAIGAYRKGTIPFPEEPSLRASLGSKFRPSKTTTHFANIPRWSA